jgi:hypothetical protein
MARKQRMASQRAVDATRKKWWNVSNAWQKRQGKNLGEDNRKERKKPRGKQQKRKGKNLDKDNRKEREKTEAKTTEKKGKNLDEENTKKRGWWYASSSNMIESLSVVVKCLWWWWIRSLIASDSFRKRTSRCALIAEPIDSIFLFCSVPMQIFGQLNESEMYFCSI